jgi:hypothetical protein
MSCRPRTAFASPVTSGPRYRADGQLQGERTSAVDQEHLVLVTPTPLFSGLERAHDRMPARVPMRGGVPTRRVVAAADVPALEALTQVHPAGALTQAVLTSLGRGRLHVCDGGQVRTLDIGRRAARVGRGNPRGHTPTLAPPDPPRRLPIPDDLGVLVAIRPEVQDHAAAECGYSHSIVAGGLDVTSSTTRLTSRTSLVIRVEIRSSTS